MLGKNMYAMGLYGSPITPMGLLWDHYGNGTKILASPMGVMGPGYGTKIFLVPWELARSKIDPSRVELRDLR